ncbi:hypothetical protein SAMN05216474_2687 [Lishizhenia tianjinensis]|uniref:Uncharacterized protein n=1 Tax=Lishizhenia tianjinensis TaxID=477690 RepID=A0A1I7BCS7_9FLAO|nr:hypothetical protein [Lishizhenia tianjinensis]SFT85003.1 hypothetical protein SAMN05216474_2687 [Lishizhenia tianjinensis]
MKIRIKKVYSKTEATIKLSWLRSIDVTVPTRHVMYMCSDPLRWNEIDQINFNKETLKEVVSDLLDLEVEHNAVLAEMFLKISGNHPNKFENEFVKQMIVNHELNNKN